VKSQKKFQKQSVLQNIREMLSRAVNRFINEANSNDTQMVNKMSAILKAYGQIGKTVMKARLGAIPSGVSVCYYEVPVEVVRPLPQVAELTYEDLKDLTVETQEQATKAKFLYEDIFAHSRILFKKLTQVIEHSSLLSSQPIYSDSIKLILSRIRQHLFSDVPISLSFNSANGNESFILREVEGAVLAFNLLVNIANKSYIPEPLIRRAECFNRIIPKEYHCSAMNFLHMNRIKAPEYQLPPDIAQYIVRLAYGDTKSVINDILTLNYIITRINSMPKTSGYRQQYIDYSCIKHGSDLNNTSAF